MLFLLILQFNFLLIKYLFTINIFVKLLIFFLMWNKYYIKRNEEKYKNNLSYLLYTSPKQIRKLKRSRRGWFFLDHFFRCTKCEFTLNFGCTTSPHTIKYKQHEHPFTLNYIAEDDSSEYYYDIYEEKRDHLNHWFYNCEECRYPAHPKCIFGEFLNTKDGDYRNIKFRSTYISTIHQHLLTLLQETMDVSHCNNCCRPCKDIAYACATCNISFDWQCASIKWEKWDNWHPIPMYQGWTLP